MAARHRLTIRSIDPDPRAVAIERSAAQLGITAPGGAPIQGLAVADVIFIDGELTIEQLHALHAVLVDPLIQRGSWDSPNGSGVEVSLKPGVTDSIAGAVHHAADRLGLPVSTAASALRVEFHQPIEPSIADTIVARLVANPIVEQWVEGTIEPQFPDRNARPHAAARIDVASLDAAGLDALDRERSLSLDPEELIALRDHYAVLGRDATDVEIETIAQTWSEHCSHKTFRALIDVVGEAGDEPDASVEAVEPLLAQLRRCTDAIGAPFVTSAFDGNAGIVQFTKHGTIALKAETHNHPSAVEPFGGANTGVGGVIRDVLGAAHRPIAVTDILCFGSPDLPLDELPPGSLHPRRVREGVIEGIADYGNKIGLPTVAGAILYDDAYTTNPLVFAGCIGTAPPLPRHEGPHRGDRVLLLGGATGRDGIRGATFSSATMDATTGEVAGASVQIGDPIVEKLLIDALVGAEDLYSAITDCGAGGLSSAVGEMAEGIGADIDLDTVPRKYPGLEPWEVWLSEAQERMVVAVAPRNVSALERRCARVGVALADIGRFTGDGRLVVRADGDIVAELDTAFLHDGRPQRRMRAEKIVPSRGGGTTRTVGDPAATLLALLAHRNIASKATTIHRYDHEILGATLVRPLVGVA
ncbi:MAG: AIR synthase-related protein, partial [Acidimicrobiia bacterium]|nr:AIR synthase-related protein [Acidimicrobiia bacterium]